MNGKSNFQSQMVVLEREVGQKKADKCYIVFAATVKWLVENGHGTIELNAVDNELNTKIRFRTICDSSDIL